MQAAALNTAVRDTLRKSLGRFPPVEGVACAFPLRLSGVFTANHSVLSWGTQADGVGRFVLERSYDGAIFTPLAFIDQQPQQNSYLFHDQDAPQPKNNYRLRQNNLAGATVYSNTVALDRPLANNLPFILVNNPVGDYIDIQMGLLQNSPGNIFSLLHGQATLRLVDLQGRLIHSQQQSVAVYQRLRMTASNLPRGIYLLQVVINDILYTKKIMKL
jgi:hypothetical protein